MSIWETSPTSSTVGVCTDGAWSPTAGILPFLETMTLGILVATNWSPSRIIATSRHSPVRSRSTWLR